MDYTALENFWREMRKNRETFFARMSELKRNPTKEYLNMLAPFSREADRMSQLIRPYAKNCEEFFQNALSTVVHWEYSRGGAMLERGFYHPCPVADLITGGVNRGQLLKDVRRAKSPPDFTYGFNAEGKMSVICDVDSTYSNENAWIVYDGNRTITLYFRSGNNGTRITRAVECVYDEAGLIKKSDALFAFGDSVNKLELCEYSYSDKGIYRMSRLEFSPNFHMATVHSWEFEHDEEGFLSKYWLIPVDGNTPDKYNILLKRKV